MLPHRPSVQAPGLLLGQGRRAVTLVRGVAFWFAVVLPAAVLVALIAGQAGVRPELVGGLAVANLLCIFVGHDYSPE